MIRPVYNIITHDTGRDLTDLYNEAGDIYDFEPYWLLVGHYAESDLKERATRGGPDDPRHPWPDWSVGLAQHTLKWWGNVVPDVTVLGSGPDKGTAEATRHNWNLFVDYFSVAENSFTHNVPLFVRYLRAHNNDPLEAWCRWNRPSIAGIENPNRANYQRCFRLAEQHLEKRSQEVPSPMTALSEPVLAKLREELGIVDIRNSLPTLKTRFPGRYSQQEFYTRSLADLTGHEVHYTEGAVDSSLKAIVDWQTDPRSINQWGADPPQPAPGFCYGIGVKSDGVPYLVWDANIRTWSSAASPGGIPRNRSHVASVFTGNKNSGAPNNAQVWGLAKAHYYREREIGRVLSLSGHRDAPYATECPGPTWPQWKPLLVARIGRLRDQYLNFGEAASPGRLQLPREDWERIETLALNFGGWAVEVLSDVPPARRNKLSEEFLEFQQIMVDLRDRYRP